MDEQISTRSLSPDMIFEILLKAKIKPLLRCKSVCKKWYDLISGEHFIKSRYKHHRLIYKTGGKENNLKICPLSDVIIDKSVSNATQLEIPIQLERSQPSKIRIVGSCNGLLCILVEDDNTLFIYNPTTGRTSDSILPPPEQGAGYYGFGYDETTHDYKVVKIWRYDSGWGTLIYSLKAGSWKEKSESFPCLEPLNDGKFLNGALHWATGDGWPRDIVSLDLGKETYGYFLKLPYDKRSKRLTLGVFGEWLCVLCNYPESENREADVWMIQKDYGVQDSWTKLRYISHPNDRHALLCVSNDEKLLLQRGAKLDVYDFINGSYYYSEIQNFDGFREAYIIVESPIWPFAP